MSEITPPDTAPEYLPKSPKTSPILIPPPKEPPERLLPPPERLSPPPPEYIPEKVAEFLKQSAQELVKDLGKKSLAALTEGKSTPGIQNAIMDLITQGRQLSGLPEKVDLNEVFIQDRLIEAADLAEQMLRQQRQEKSLTAEDKSKLEAAEDLLYQTRIHHDRLKIKSRSRLTNKSEDYVRDEMEAARKYNVRSLPKTLQDFDWFNQIEQRIGIEIGKRRTSELNQRIKQERDKKLSLIGIVEKTRKATKEIPEYKLVSLGLRTTAMLAAITVGIIGSQEKNLNLRPSSIPKKPAYPQTLIKFSQPVLPDLANESPLTQLVAPDLATVPSDRILPTIPPKEDRGSYKLYKETIENQAKSIGILPPDALALAIFEGGKVEEPAGMLQMIPRTAMEVVSRLSPSTLKEFAFYRGWITPEMAEPYLDPQNPQDREKIANLRVKFLSEFPHSAETQTFLALTYLREMQDKYGRFLGILAYNSPRSADVVLKTFGNDKDKANKFLVDVAYFLKKRKPQTFKINKISGIISQRYDSFTDRPYGHINYQVTIAEKDKKGKLITRVIEIPGGHYLFGSNHDPHLVNLTPAGIKARPDGIFDLLSSKDLSPGNELAQAKIP